MIQLYIRVKKLYDVQRKLESESLVLFEWFYDNYLKANSGKSHAMLITDNELKINVKCSPLSNEKIVKLLGVTVDNKLSFEPHLNLVCTKVSQKRQALARVSKFIKEEDKGYHEGICYVEVQLLASRTLNNKVNKPHERVLRLVYKDRQSTLEDLLNIDKPVSIKKTNVTCNYKKN